MERVEEPGGVRLRCHGELDLATIAQLEDGVRALVASGASQISIDVRELDFIDFGGLHGLERAHALAVHAGCDVRLLCETGTVARLLGLTGQAGRFPRRGRGSGPSDPAG